MGSLKKASRELGPGRSKADPNPPGSAGYDNPRENIDPDIKTKVIRTLEGTIEGAPVNSKDIANKAYVDALPVGETNTASNVGGEKEVFKQKTGVDLEFRTLKQGANVTLTENVSDIEIAATDTGEANTASNQGGEKEIYIQKTGVDLELRTLKAGSNVTLTQNAQDIEIASSGGGAAGSGVINHFAVWSGSELRHAPVYHSGNAIYVSGGATMTVGDTIPSVGSSGIFNILPTSQHYQGLSCVNPVSGASDTAFRIEQQDNKRCLLFYKSGTGTGDVNVGVNTGTGRSLVLMSSTGANTETFVVDRYGHTDISGNVVVDGTAFISGNTTVLGNVSGSTISTTGDCTVDGEMKGSRCTFSAGETVAKTATFGLKVGTQNIKSNGGGIPMPRAGSIVGVGGRSLLTALEGQDGDLVWTSYINGVAKLTATEAVPQSGATYRTETATAARGTHTFSAGDHLGMEGVFSTFSGTADNSVMMVEVVFDT
jgi:hypothetical protein